MLKRSRSSSTKEREPKRRGSSLNQSQEIGSIHILPYELLMTIFEWVKLPPMLAHCAMVCRLWHALVWNRLSELDVSPHQQGRRALIPLDDRRLLLLVNHCPRLTKLNLARCVEVTDVGLGYLSFINSLKRLSLRSCRKITNQGLAILRHLTKLHALDLSDSATVTDAALTCLQQLTQLEVLRLSDVEQLTNQGLAHVSYLIYLRELDLGGSRAITDLGMTSLRPLTAMTKLSLAGLNRIQHKGWECLHGLTNIRKLNLSGAVIALTTLRNYITPFLTRLTRLEAVRLGFCDPLNDEFCQIFSRHLTNVTSLAVDNSTNLTSDGLKHLSRLHKFEFKRSHIPFYAFRALTNLHKLNIENCVLKVDEQGRDHAIRDLAKMTRLTELNVSLEGLRDRHIGYIARCRQLHTLHALWLHRVTEDGLAKLTRLTDLKWLNVTNCEAVTDQVLEQLAASCAQLEALVLTRCSSVTDQGLVTLTALQQLKYLILYQLDKISDNGLIALASLSNLELIEVTGCKKITEKGIDELYDEHATVHVNSDFSALPVDPTPKSANSSYNCTVS